MFFEQSRWAHKKWAAMKLILITYFYEKHECRLSSDADFVCYRRTIFHPYPLWFAMAAVPGRQKSAKYF